jgi:hypothetical protein
MGFGEVVMKRQGIPKGSPGGDQVPFPHVGQSNAIVGYFWVLISGDLQGFAPLCHRIIPTSQLQIQARQMDMGLGIAWGQLQRFGVVGQRKLITSLVVVSKREKVMKLRICRVELQCIV